MAKLGSLTPATGQIINYIQAFQGLGPVPICLLHYHILLQISLEEI